MKRKVPVVLGPEDKLAEGDSKVIYDAVRLDEAGLEGEDDVSLFEHLKRSVNWQTMSHASGPVPRLVNVQGNINIDGSFPVYRHPADESIKLEEFSPAILKLKAQVEDLVGHPLNHALIQLYRDGNDWISEHADKTLDVVKGSYIVNVSLGARRTMRLRMKKAACVEAGLELDDGARPTQRIPLPHRSVFVMGLQTNEKWLHSITQDKRPLSERDADETAFGGERISITLRHIGTFLNSDETKIWGQGARLKEPLDGDALRVDNSTPGFVVNGDPEQTRQIIDAFGFENHSGTFDWSGIYGSGFDVLHFASVPKGRANDPPLTVN